MDFMQLHFIFSSVCFSSTNALMDSGMFLNGNVFFFSADIFLVTNGYYKINYLY